jgi:hypothetical protein
MGKKIEIGIDISVSYFPMISTHDDLWKTIVQAIDFRYAEIDFPHQTRIKPRHHQTMHEVWWHFADLYYKTPMKQLTSEERIINYLRVWDNFAVVPQGRRKGTPARLRLASRKLTGGTERAGERCIWGGSLCWRKISTSRQAHSKPNKTGLTNVLDPKRASQFSRNWQRMKK